MSETEEFIEVASELTEPSELTLVMWDIDHTLLATQGVGTEIYAAAFEQVTGAPYRVRVSPMGTTEPQLFKAALAANGLSELDADALFPQLAEIQAAGYRTRAAELRRRGRALPGAHAVLKQLSNAPGVHQTVVTGNTPQSSEAKLEIFGLLDVLDLSSGAYGTDANRRSRLVELAIERSTNARGTFDRAVVIGDTPLDVGAGREAGVITVGVTTGTSGAEQLLAAGAHRVFESLADPAVPQFILGHMPDERLASPGSHS